MPAWVKLGDSVMTGEPVFPVAFGMNVWEHRKAHPELDESFNRAMADLKARARSSVLDAYDFSGGRLVVDIADDDVVTDYGHRHHPEFGQADHVVEPAKQRGDRRLART